jgi:thioredoxin-related protein
MKNIAAVVVVYILLSVQISSQSPSTTVEVKWYTVEEAFELTRKNPKKIFIDFYTTWCGWCKVMDRNTFSHPTIISMLNSDFYPVKFNAESTKDITIGGRTFKGQRIETTPEGLKRKLPNEFAYAYMQGKMSFPTTSYLDERFALLSSVPGYQNPDNLEVILAFFATNAYKSQQWGDFSKKYREEKAAKKTEEEKTAE